MFCFPMNSTKYVSGKEKKRKKTTPCEAAESWWEVLEANWWKRRVCFAPKRRKLLPFSSSQTHCSDTHRFCVRSKGPTTQHTHPGLRGAENRTFIAHLYLFFLTQENIILCFNRSFGHHICGVSFMDLCFCLFSVGLGGIIVLFYFLGGEEKALTTVSNPCMRQACPHNVSTHSRRPVGPPRVK